MVADGNKIEAHLTAHPRETAQSFTLHYKVLDKPPTVR
jgi:hypothetical protein